jgi:hypothetical protein
LAELEDTLDEDYELEISEPALSMELRKIYKRKHPDTIDRRTYVTALLTLQAELIKLQDWVGHTGAKVAVIFEGRNSAGKGGVIKRITQRLNPRVCRVVALSNPTERDLLNRVVAVGREPASVLLEEVMTLGPMTIGNDRPLFEALYAMLGNNFRHLPVVDEGGRADRHDVSPGHPCGLSVLA